jgi:hypothetical protein
MPQISKPGKSVYLDVGIWYDEEQDAIHMTAKDVDGFHTTVNNDGKNLRGHPNLFYKLANVLREAGAPAPSPRAEPSDA